MPKAYDPKPESEELYLKLMHVAPGESPSVQMVDKDGYAFEVGSVAVFTPDGVRLVKHIDRELAARAGLTNALDANGRLKVIGQEVEAERLQNHTYRAEAAHGDNTLSLGARSDGAVVFGIKSDLGFAVVALPPNNLRDLRDRINGHLAYLEQEGLDKP